MSDITNTRRSQDLLEASDKDPKDPRLLMKAAIHASLASARALRELDGTTHRTVRLIGDSVDEMSADLVRVLSTKFVKVDDSVINVGHITAMVDVEGEDGEDNATRTEIWLTDGNVIYSRMLVADIITLMVQS